MICLLSLLQDILDKSSCKTYKVSIHLVLNEYNLRRCVEFCDITMYKLDRNEILLLLKNVVFLQNRSQIEVLSYRIAGSYSQSTLDFGGWRSQAMPTMIKCRANSEAVHYGKWGGVPYLTIQLNHIIMAIQNILGKHLLTSDLPQHRKNVRDCLNWCSL